MSKNVEKQFTARQRKYANWKANPYRDENKGQMAEKLKVTYKTLERWDKLDGFKKYVDELIDDYVGDKEANIWRALIKSASSIYRGSSADRKLFFQLRGKLIEKQQYSFDDKVEKVKIEITKNDTQPESN